MTSNIIKSKQNPLVKKALSLRDKRGRQKHQAFLLEGPVVIGEAIRENYPLQIIFIAASQRERFTLPHTDIPMILLDDALMEQLTDTVTKPGIIAIAEIMPRFTLGSKPWIYLDQVQDPGNVGTIIRCADAFGFGGILLSQGSVDPYNEKVLRSTMASVLRIPIKTKAGIEDLLERQRQGYRLVGADIGDATPIKDWHPQPKTILVMGSEAHGLSQDIQAILDQKVTIPMPGRAESLNVGVAAGILMHHLINCN